jgi:branched-chain amino acid transport system substrate-binding protein
MTRRLYAIAAVAAIAGFVAIGIAFHREAPRTVKIGYVVSLSGPNAPGVRSTVLPNYRLWIKEVNAAGGIMLSSIGKRVPVEVVEYDDESKVDKALEAVEKLIKTDKVDFVLPPWGTGLNVVVGPLFHSAGYPHLVVTALTDQAPELAKRWPNSFWFLGTVTHAAESLVTTLGRLRSAGKLGESVAIVSVADQLGIGLAKAARRELEKGGFNIVYDRSYTVGQTDMRAIITEVKRLNPETFLAFSYPPDTMAITEEARTSNFNPKVFYAAIGTAYPLFSKRFGADVEGVMGTGGWSPNTPEIKDYRRRHLESEGQEPDRWASPITYASLQMLQQAIERVGEIDRARTVEELGTGTFETILGPIKLENNFYTKSWWLGQWQNGEYYGIAPAALPGAQAIIFPKPAWSPDR